MTKDGVLMASIRTTVTHRAQHHARLTPIYVIIGGIYRCDSVSLTERVLVAK